MKETTLFGDGTTTTMMIVCAADDVTTHPFEDDGSTLETEAITVEVPPIVPDLPAALEGEPAYMVEIHPSRGAPTLLAIRATLEEARLVAEAVHPAIAEVVIREMPLPCDADSLVRVLTDSRLWSRDESGAWSPPFDDADATQIIGSFR